MRILGISLIVTILMKLLSSLAVAQKTDSEVVLTLSRTKCFGTCPVYNVTVFRDGTVVFEGKENVLSGTHIMSIEPEMVQGLINGFVEAGYFDWSDKYTQVIVTDMPSVITSVTHNGTTKRVEHYLGDSSAPLALSYLEKGVDLVLGVNKFIQADVPPLVPFAETITSIITLERTMCFGYCPVYKLEIYSDGTVVYTGIMFVDVPGVRISSIEAEMVTALAEMMNDTGYFDWQDEYNNMFITDLPTIITSLRWDNQFKRISRYDGDPNAPLGLFRFEKRIDSIVNVSQWVGEVQ